MDYIVTNAGGFGALLIEYEHLLTDDAEWKDNGKWFAEQVTDVSQGRLPAFSEPA